MHLHFKYISNPRSLPNMNSCVVVVFLFFFYQIQDVKRGQQIKGLSQH